MRRHFRPTNRSSLSVCSVMFRTRHLATSNDLIPEYVNIAMCSGWAQFAGQSSAPTCSKECSATFEIRSIWLGPSSMLAAVMVVPIMSPLERQAYRSRCVVCLRISSRQHLNTLQQRQHLKTARRACPQPSFDIQPFGGKIQAHPAMKSDH